MIEGKEVREFNGVPCVLEVGLKADFALMRADKADRWGNVAFRGLQANFGSAMASAAGITPGLGSVDQQHTAALGSVGKEGVRLAGDRLLGLVRDNALDEFVFIRD